MAFKLQYPAGSKVAQIEITGNMKACEPETVRINFPGGDVEVVRARDGEDADYWVHLRVNRPADSMAIDGETEQAKIIDARIDIHGNNQKAVDFKHPQTYHVALRVCRDGIFKLRQEKGEY